MRFVLLALATLFITTPASAQAVEGYRVVEVEERVRELTGKVEELTFQILQLQEQLRKQQEDTELRFQELEDRRGDAGPAAGGDGTDVAEAQPRLGKPKATAETAIG